MSDVTYCDIISRTNGSLAGPRHLFAGAHYSRHHNRWRDVRTTSKGLPASSFGCAARVAGLSPSPGSVPFIEATGILLDTFAPTVTLRRAAE